MSDVLRGLRGINVFNRTIIECKWTEERKNVTFENPLIEL